MLSCYIEDKNNNASYDITEGAVFVENYNETLDSGTILIQQLPSEIDIEPYDIIAISGDNINTRRFCVDTYTCTQISLNPSIYKYEISLCSETKILETYLCPSMSITKHIGSTPKKIHTYIEYYINLYGPKLYSDESSGAYGNKITLGASLNRFYNLDCPEMQWNHPTLREVLNDLMMVDDCIPVLRNNVLECIDISDIGTEITDEQKLNINYIQTSQSSEDYVSELKMNLVNSANNNVSTNINDATTIIEKIGFRNNDSYLLTTENMLLQTSFPIWKIFSCIAHVKITVAYVYNVYIGGSSNPTEHSAFETPDDAYQRDITSYILEYKEWLTKNVYYGAWNLSQLDLSTDYRNTCLYYVRGAKNIHNFNNKVTSSFLWITTNQFVYELIANDPNVNDFAQRFAEQRIEEMQASDPNNRYVLIKVNGTTINDFKTAKFELTYEPIDECVFTASKSPLKVNHRTVVDNQTNSYIDVNRQGMLEYLKANRLGNKMALINGRFSTHENTMPTLAQKINNRIIFRKEISVYNKYINVNYNATENYVLQDYFTSVRAKLRSWRVISGDEAFVRADLIKFYVNNNINSVSNTNRIIPVYNSLNDYLNNFKYCAVRFYTTDSSSVTSVFKPVPVAYDSNTYNTNGIMCEFSKHIIGNSVVFTIRMPDNYYAGNYISNYSGTDGRVEQKGIAYTDNNGEFSWMMILFYNRYNPDYWSDEEANRALKPLVNIGVRTNGADGANLNSADLVFKTPLYIHKDNKEITQVSIQFELNNEANDLFLGYKKL